jgi:3-methylfumaryl-CoA hydratase
MMVDPDVHIGREEVVCDFTDRRRFSRLAAMLDHEQPPWREGVVPPLGHWLCFQPDSLQSRLGTDGHPDPGGDGLIPDFRFPRRMWAGSRIAFHSDLSLDAPVVRTTTLKSATPKTGSSGAILIVTLEHRIASEEGAIAIVEEQDIIYREAAPAGETAARPSALARGCDDQITRSMVSDPTLLFRYSALTFNAHRIHYDRQYARAVEGYPDLVVQGPLLATLMLDNLLRHRDGVRIRSFGFRARSPIFVGEKVRLGARLNGNLASFTVTGPMGIAITGDAAVSS